MEGGAQGWRSDACRLAGGGDGRSAQEAECAVIGQRIQQARLAAGLSLSQVVRLLAEKGQSVTEAEFAAFEAGEQLLERGLLDALGDVLGVRPPLVMELSSFAHLPATVMPLGYRIRPYRAGDALEWCRLINDTLGGPYDERGFLEYQLLERGIAEWPAATAEFEPDGLYFAEREGRAVGTACAIWRVDLSEDRGYVHMVVVEQAHRGRGLGRALLLTTLHHLRSCGFRRASLQTDDHRLPAIRLYLSLGFGPQFTDESHPARWDDVRRQLGHGGPLRCQE